MIELPQEFAGFRQAKLEDGEPVVMIRGWKKNGQPSDQPHGGMWGKDCAYILVPDVTRISRAMREAMAMCPGLKNRSGDSDFMLHGSVGEIAALMARGPSMLRARYPRGSATAAHLSAHQFRPS